MMGEGMEQITTAEVRVGQAYEGVRTAERTRLIEIKRPRRVQLGDLMSLVFENRDTLQRALEEALRSDRTADPDHVASEVAAVNGVLPPDRGLCALLCYEVIDPADLQQRIEAFEGIQHRVMLEVGTVSIPARASEAEPGAAVHLLFLAMEEDAL